MSNFNCSCIKRGIYILILRIGKSIKVFRSSCWRMAAVVSKYTSKLKLNTNGFFKN